MPEQRSDLQGLLGADFGDRRVDGLVAQGPHARGKVAADFPDWAGRHRFVSGLGAAGVVLILAHPLLEKPVDPADDRLLRAKILHQLDGLAAGLFHSRAQAFHLFHVGATEPVDRLLGIAHHEQLARLRTHLIPARGTNARVTRRRNCFGQQHGDFRLDRVGVLGLVDQQVRVPPAEVIADGQVVPQQFACPHQQILKLRTTLGAPFLGVIQNHPPEVFKNGQKHNSAGPFDFSNGVLV